MLPAVPMVNLYSPGWMAPGSKVNSLEPMCAPSALARPDGGGGGDGREVLALQPRLVAPRPDVEDAEGLARDERERQGRADDLPAALAV